jgi:hypothetical protein
MLSFKLYERVLPAHGLKPVVLRPHDAHAHFKSVHTRHHDIGQHKIERPRTAAQHQSLLEALHCLCACIEDDAANIQFIEHQLYRH